MCGISGIFFKDNQSVSRDILVAMTRTMVHRGPDDEGYHLDGPVGLGFRRLSIIDLSGGHQPIFNEDGSICVILNGEIYNFAQIRKELEAKGHPFKTHSDTEVIVHAYEEYGVRCLDHFRGMFAFALHDRKRNACLLARDRLGKKPLYYFEDSSVFLFASEIKALLKTPYVSSKMDEEAIDFFLTLNYVPAPRTLFKGIKKLEPGSYLWVEKGRVQKGSFWNPEEQHPSTKDSFDEAAQHLREMLFESVELRMISDVPLGVFLSGGLDSSMVAAVMSRLSNQPVKTFSVGYREENVSELKFARQVAEHLRTDHHEFVLTPEGLWSSLELLLEHTEEPMGECAPIAIYELARLAKPKVTVMLSGEGADEVLGGYPLYRKASSLQRLSALSHLPGWKVFSSRRTFLPEKALKYMDWLEEPFPEGYRSVSCEATRSIRNRMYTDRFRRLSGGLVDEFFENYWRRIQQRSLLSQMQLIDTRFWLPDDLLMRADKMTMAASIELRTPFLDHKLVEYAFTLPDSFKIAHGSGKVLLKKVAEEFLPHGIIHRVKRGFAVPVAQWFRGELHESVKKVLLDDDSQIQEFIRADYLKEILERHRDGESNLSQRIFTFLALELWHRKYVRGAEQCMGEVVRSA